MCDRRRLRLSLKKSGLERVLLGLWNLERGRLWIGLRRLDFVSWRISPRWILGFGGTTFTRASTSHTCLWRPTESCCPFRCATSRTKSALQVSLGTSTAWELLITFCLRLRTIAAGNRRSTCRLGYYALWRQSFLVVLISTVYGVMAL
jgi:hypothetical protein